MTYNPNSFPIGGRAGQEDWSLHYDAPDFLARQTAAEQPVPELVVIEFPERKVDPVQANLERLKEIIAEMKAPFEQAIEDKDGSEPHHAAELAHLDEMHQRIAYLINSFSLQEPINAAFVEEAIVGFDVLDGDQGAHQQDYTTWTQREAVLDQAVAAARASDQGSA